MKRSTLIPLTLALAALAPLAACGSTTTAQRYDHVIASNQQDFEVQPDGDVLHACGLDTSRAYFAYNSSELSVEDQQVLGDVGTCLTSGVLKGRSVLVTGYTDQDGTSGDNLALGFERSRAVALELASRGVAQTRIFLRSRGDSTATGETTTGRALDRKVELRVVARD